MKKRVLQILLVGIMLLALLVSGLVSCKKDDDDTPVDTAPPVDSGAVDDSGDSNDSDEIKLNAPDNGGAAGLEYKKAVKLDISDKEVTLFFVNAARSTHNVTVQLVAEGNVLAESGLITPGKKITKLAVKDGASISAGVYETGAKLVIKYYDIETNAASAVNSEFNIKLTVVA